MTDTAELAPRQLLASALLLEHGAAKLLGDSIRVGMRCERRMPTTPVISFGYAGALVPMRPGTIIDGVKVVDEDGTELWRGTPLGIPGARQATVVTTDYFVSSAQERAALALRTGAEVVDMESGRYARSGLLRGYARVISDVPGQPLFSMRGIWYGVVATHKLYTMQL